ncbi:MAG: hypothetical protein JO013_13990 [Alphaproteobacteria bacterium]|nr:hypothetical protein [Alphaproteobacteria bacterium]
MKKRWKIAIGAGGVLATLIVVPILYIEGSCRGPLPQLRPDAPYTTLLRAGPGRRAEAATWLTYPEWHIVYSAESFGRFLRDRPPSAFPYFRHIGRFWSSYCALNRVTSGAPGTGEAKLTIYTIGISYTVELGIKAVYERTFGRLFEWASGWHSADDLYAARVQQRYGTFLHETPWYEFPFGRAFSGLWRTSEPREHGRHWERRFALSLEYGGKAGYAKLIGWASNASMGADERRLRMVVRGSPAAAAGVDPRIRPVARIGDALTVVDVPRYAQLTDILGKLAAAQVDPVEIAGNDDIFATVLLPPGTRQPPGTAGLLAMPLDDRPGWRRLGLSMKVPALGAVLRRVRAAGGEIEHVYDY